MAAADDFRVGTRGRKPKIGPFDLINPMARVLDIGERQKMLGIAARRSILDFLRTRPGKRPASLDEIKKSVPGVNYKAKEHLDRLISVGAVRQHEGRYTIVEGF